MSDHPKIVTDFDKTVDANENFYNKQMLIASVAGRYYPYDNKIVLAHGEFSNELLQKFKRSLEKQTCATISHEILHQVIFEEQNIKVSSAFDNIAKKLAPYGVY